LSNETYLGRLAWGKNTAGRFAGVVGFEVKERSGQDAGAVTPKPRDEWVENDGTHEALVDPDTFARVQAKMAKMTRGKKNPPAEYPLAGILVCDHCHRHMSGVTLRRKLKGGGESAYPRYYCQNYCKGATPCEFNSILADDLLGAVVKRLQET